MKILKSQGMWCNLRQGHFVCVIRIHTIVDIVLVVILVVVGMVVGIVVGTVVIIIVIVVKTVRELQKQKNMVRRCSK